MPEELTFQAEVVDDLTTVPQDTWNALAGTDNPFVRHEFLAALERNGCVGDRFGWAPRHLILRLNGAIVGAMPMYLKGHSYGEFVFDWGWADAYERSGHKYYPKLVVAIPFTPATGPRLLLGEYTEETRQVLAAAAIQVAREGKVSSVHWLFPDDDEIDSLDNLGLLIRWGQQFHWHNQDFRDFQDYLDAMTHKKRKQIRHERRDADAAPVEVEVLLGRDIQEHQWEAYHALYASTYDRKWGYPSLTTDFFKEVGETMPNSAMLVLGRRDGRYIAGAHLFLGKNTLYGRNWGCTEFHRALHFEMCYYRPIQYCIENGIGSFEAGAGGDHKISRGFLPVKTRSAHWIDHEAFRAAIADFLARERRAIGHHLEAMDDHSPFKAGLGLEDDDLARGPSAPQLLADEPAKDSS